MEVKFLGTSSGRTRLDKYHSSILLKKDSRNILIDVGDSISRALLKQNIEFNTISDIIISHHHSDHLAGLPSLLTQMKLGNRIETLNIYSQSDLLNSLKRFLHISYIFQENLPFSIKFIDFEYDKRNLLDKNFYFKAMPNSHINNKSKMIKRDVKYISSSFMFEINRRKIIYTSDIGNSDDLYLFNKKNTDLFITEATHIHYSQIEKLMLSNYPKKIYITHIDDEENLKNWYEKLTAPIKGKIIIAVDGLSVDI